MIIDRDELLLLIRVFTIGMMVLALIPIAYVDLRSFRIPDPWTGVFVGSGALYQLTFGVDRLAWFAFGAAFTGVLALVLKAIHHRITGRIGLGMGDVKFVAAAMLWLEPGRLPVFILLAAMLGLAYALIMDHTPTETGPRRMRRVPFGPFLVSSFLAILLLQESECSIAGHLRKLADLALT